MKKFRTLISIVVFSIIMLSVNSCKKATDAINPTDNCDELMDAYTVALNAWVSTPSETTCEAYVDALDKLINGCAILTAAQRAEFNNQLEDADCSQY
jgi:6-phosphogluconate dehydrogenase (decarboxylating)